MKAVNFILTIAVDVNIIYFTNSIINFEKNLFFFIIILQFICIMRNIHETLDTVYKRNNEVGNSFRFQVPTFLKKLSELNIEIKEQRENNIDNRIQKNTLFLIPNIPTILQTQFRKFATINEKVSAVKLAVNQYTSKTH